MEQFPAPLGSLPVGLAMAMAQDPKAIQAFATLSPARQKEIIRAARLVRSHGEMVGLVLGLVQNNGAK